MSYLDEIDGETFQVSLSVSSFEPPTHLLRPKFLIGPTFGHGSIRRISGNIHSEITMTLIFFYVSLYLSFSRTRKHTYAGIGVYFSVALPILFRSRPVNRAVMRSS